MREHTVDIAVATIYAITVYAIVLWLTKKFTLKIMGACACGSAMRGCAYKRACRPGLAPYSRWGGAPAAWPEGLGHRPSCETSEGGRPSRRVAGFGGRLRTRPRSGPR